MRRSVGSYIAHRPSLTPGFHCSILQASVPQVINYSHRHSGSASHGDDEGYVVSVTTQAARVKSRLCHRVQNSNSRYAIPVYYVYTIIGSASKHSETPRTNRSFRLPVSQQASTTHNRDVYRGHLSNSFAVYRSPNKSPDPHYSRDGDAEEGWGCSRVDYR